MNVNDIIVQGAEPLYFTDVFSCSKLDVDIAESVIKGICDGCTEAGCALIGGETAEMAGFFKDDRYDVVGTCTGAVARGRKILPDKNGESFSEHLCLRLYYLRSSRECLIHPCLPNTLTPKTT